MSNADGWIVIGTELDSTELEKDLKDEKNKLKQYEKEAEKLTEQKTKYEANLSEYEKEIKEYDKLMIKASDYEQKITELKEENMGLVKGSDKWLTNRREIKSYEESVRSIDEKLSSQEKHINDINSKYKDTETKLKKITDEIKKNADVQEIVKNEISNTNDKLLKAKGYDEINKKIENVGKSVQNVTKKIGKWALALVGVRTAVGLVRRAISTVSQYDEQISADIQYMGYALASTLKPVVEQIVNLAYKLLTYIGYIAQAWLGVNIFANASAKAMNKAVGSAKEIKKQLAGFDEMNIVQDDSSSSGSSSVMPSFDLSQNDIDPPKWLTWIVENGEHLIGIIELITFAIAGLHGGIVGLVAMAVVTKIIEIIKTISDLISWLQNPTWEGFYTLLKDIIVLIFGPLGYAINWILDLVTNNGELLKSVFEGIWNKIQEIFTPVIEFFRNIFDGAFNKIKEIFSPVIDFFSSIFGTVFENIKVLIDNAKQIFSFLWDKIKEIFGPVVDFFKEKFISAFNKIKEVFSPIVNFFSDIFNKVKSKLKDFGAKVGEIIGGAFKTVVNGVLGAIETILNTPIKSINKLINVINNVPGINLGKLQTFKLPRLAKGGIVNMPGRGVPVGNAIVGERGQEGVIPLTDEHQMDLLGESIARHISFDVNVINKLDGRTVSRNQTKINNRLAFAKNGG